MGRQNGSDLDYINLFAGETDDIVGHFLSFIRSGAVYDRDVLDILDVLDSGALANPMFRLKGAGILAGNYATAFPLKHMQKDLRLAIDLGDRLNQSLPCAATANEQYKEAKQEGYGDEDFSAIYKIIR